VTETVERHVGQSVRRREDTALTTGRGTWTDGIAVPGTLHLAVLRSPVAQIVESGAIGSSPAVVNAVIDAIAHRRSRTWTCPSPRRRCGERSGA
jgi:aerobic carbon-monoxide dehydrogenase large subunit